MNAFTAKQCFQENLELFSNPQTEPEKYNLYKGLLGMADAILDLEQKIKNIQDSVRYIQSSSGR